MPYSDAFDTISVIGLNTQMRIAKATLARLREMNARDEYIARVIHRIQSIRCALAIRVSPTWI